MKKRNYFSITLKHKSFEAFTLTELLISIVIIAICVLSVSLMFQQALRGNPAIKSLTQATALAERLMEESIAEGFSLSNSSGTFTDFPNYNYTVNVFNVTRTDLDALVSVATEYKHVRVTVVYPASVDSIANITVDSLLTNYTNSVN